MERAARMAAPDQLKLVQAFLITNDRQNGRDALGTPTQMAAWLADRRLISPHVEFDEADRRRLIEVRAALHDLVVDRHDGAPARRAVTTLNEAARAARASASASTRLTATA